MTRRFARFRRTAPVMLGLQLLQVLLLAASVVCEPVARVAASPAKLYAQRYAQQFAQQYAQQHSHQHTNATSHSAAPDIAPAERPAPPHHGSPGTGACPMAMACTVTAIVAEVPDIAVAELRIVSARPSLGIAAPRSTLRTPEPPPPRG